MKICLLVVTETKKSSRTKQIRVRTHIYKIFSGSEREREIWTGIVLVSPASIHRNNVVRPAIADWEYVINKTKIIITRKI